MRARLTDKDIKDLKYQCRMGYVIPILIFILGSVFSSSIYELNFNPNSNEINTEIILLITFGIFLLSFFISYKMNWKYLSDIRNSEKEIEIKIIQKKEFKRDYEAGSGTLYIGQEMKGYDKFNIVVENYRYRVDENVFLNCNEGGEIIFNYAPISRYLINIEQKKARL